MGQGRIMPNIVLLKIHIPAMLNALEHGIRLKTRERRRRYVEAVPFFHQILRIRDVRGEAGFRQRITK